MANKVAFCYPQRNRTRLGRTLRGPHRIDGAAALLVERAEVAARRILDAELLEALPLRAFGLGAAASLQNLGDLACQGAGALPPARHSLAKPRQLRRVLR